MFFEANVFLRNFLRYRYFACYYLAYHQYLGGFLIKISKMVLLSCFIFTVFLSGCNNSPDNLKTTESEGKPQAGTITDNVDYTYTYDISDVKTKEEKDYFKGKNINIIDYTQTFNGASGKQKINSATYSTDTKMLIDNYYQMPSEVQIVDGKIISDHVILFVNMDFTNTNKQKTVEYYTNGYNLYGIISDNFTSWLFGDVFYQDKVMRPAPENKQYARLFVEPNSTINVTVGFIIDSRITKTKNIYLKASQTGGEQGNQFYVKLPPMTDSDTE